MLIKIHPQITNLKVYVNEWIITWTGLVFILVTIRMYMVTGSFCLLLNVLFSF